MISGEIALDYAEAYFHNRVGELRNQLPNGDPFVFLGALVLLNVLFNHSGIPIDELLPRRFKTNGAVLKEALENMVEFWSFGSGLGMLHKPLEIHNKFDSVGNLVLVAEPFLNLVDLAITKVFTDAKTDKVLAAKLYVSLNEHRLIG